ncbi:hypothetical protein evm_004975 [Chilo suppressalis]|nr:hypothetical protein evm_004975 [Chilo suppressalis]
MKVEVSTQRRRRTRLHPLLIFFDLHTYLTLITTFSKMAGKMKFHSTTLSLQAAAALILLSGIVESLQCYWCGPLAEQVHRSQRAPSCDALGDHVTACEPGYTHCAVVASSPPFVESRYCVKFYQDECYKLYCNSTKTFRMTCPCRGELCNGANTQREIDAFTVLAKAVAKTQNTRLKKRNAVHLNNFVKINKAKSANLVQNDEENMNNTKTNMDSDEIEVTKTTESTQMNNMTNNTMMLSDQPLIEKENSENAVVSEHAEMNEETNMTKTTANTDGETDNKVLEITTPKMEEHVDSNITTTKVSESAMVEQLAVDENLLMSNDIKPSMKLPTAEALQQNGGQITTTEKAVDLTTPEPMLLTSPESNSDTSPTSTTSSRNNARKVTVGAWIILNSLIFSTIV